MAAVTEGDSCVNIPRTDSSRAHLMLHACCASDYSFLTVGSMPAIEVLEFTRVRDAKVVAATLDFCAEWEDERELGITRLPAMATCYYLLARQCDSLVKLHPLDTARVSSCGYPSRRCRIVTNALSDC